MSGENEMNQKDPQEFSNIGEDEVSPLNRLYAEPDPGSEPTDDEPVPTDEVTSADPCGCENCEGGEEDPESAPEEESVETWDGITPEMVADITHIQGLFTVGAEDASDIVTKINEVYEGIEATVRRRVLAEVLAAIPDAPQSVIEVIQGL